MIDRSRETLQKQYVQEHLRAFFNPRITIRLRRRIGFRMSAAGMLIYLNPKFLPYYQGDLAKGITHYWRRRQAVYIFWLTHEVAHIQRWDDVGIPGAEHRANLWARNNFGLMCQALGHTFDEKNLLLRLLPEHYQHPERV